MAQLHVQTGDGPARVVDLRDQPVSFGRADDNDVVLVEQKASRRHCTFRPVKAGWRVVDEQSSNGTWLGGRPVLAARLQPGDEIEIGETVITYAGQPSELPPAGLVRPKRVRTIRMPWEALAGAALLAAVCWFGAGALAGDQRAREAAAWKRVATATVAEATATKDDGAYRRILGRKVQELSERPGAADAVTILRGAAARGLPAPPPPKQPEWQRALEQIEMARARGTTPAERRSRLREVLARHAGDPLAVQAVAGILRAEESSARERDESEAARLLADADAAVKDGRLGQATQDWIDWLAKSPAASREDERAVAQKMAAARQQARDDAAVALAQYEEHLKEGRLAAAKSVVDATLERLRGTGYDAWLGARTRRYGGSADPATPTAGGGPRETEEARAKRLAKEKVERAVRAADGLAAKRRFADAAAALAEVAPEAGDPALEADLRDRAEDLGRVGELVAKLLQQAKDEPARFGTIPLAEGAAAATGKVTGAADGGLLVGDAKGADVRTVPLEALPPSAFAALVEKAGLEPPSYLGAALLLHEVGEQAGYVHWMRQAVAAQDLHDAASLVHARVIGAKAPEGGYFPHPSDKTRIVTGKELKEIQNAGAIAARTALLVKTVEKIEASKQAKQVDGVRQVHAKLEKARAHALELIFDEGRYFYPYRSRMKEYAPVQRDVDERVKAVRELWEDKVSAKVRMDAALEKLLREADDHVTEIQFLGGDPTSLIERVDRVRMYVPLSTETGDRAAPSELTVQNFYATRAEQALHAWNRELMAANAKVKAGVSDAEREQVRITNEYRRMMGHRRALRLHEKLVAAARGHSDDMSKLGFFDHFSPVEGKKTPMDRMLLAGYPNTPCSENINSGAGDPQSAHDGWCHSSGHHRNLLMKDWSEMGSGQSGRYWTQNFGFAAGDEQVGGDGPH